MELPLIAEHIDVFSLLAEIGTKHLEREKPAAARTKTVHKACKEHFRHSTIANFCAYFIATKRAARANTDDSSRRGGGAFTDGQGSGLITLFA